METSIEQFLWLIHFILIGVYCIAILNFFRVLIKNPESFQIARHWKKQTGQYAYGLSEDIKEAMSFFGVGHIIAYGFAVQAVPIWLIILFGIAAYLDFWVENIGAINKKLETAQNNETSGFAEKPFSDAGFDYEESAFSGRASAPDNAAYGWDKQHPADAKFWAVVNDPNASEGERENALKAIFKAQRRRKGRAGRDLSARSA